jgi:hypothetical protein
MKNTMLLSIKQFANEYRLDYRIARRAVKENQVPSVRIGCRNLIPRAALERVMACEVTVKQLKEKSTMTNP